MAVEAINTSRFRPFLSAHPIVIVHFWADWNRLDRGMFAATNEFSEFYGPAVSFASFDTGPEEDWPLLRELRLVNLPELHFYSNGAFVSRRIGLGTKTQLRNWIDQNIVECGGDVPDANRAITPLSRLWASLKAGYSRLADHKEGHS